MCFTLAFGFENGIWHLIVLGPDIACLLLSFVTVTFSRSTIHFRDHKH